MMPMAVTMGDASGVGPEIILRRYASGELDRNILIYGDSEVLKAGSELLDLSVDLNLVESGAEMRSHHLNIIDLARLDRKNLTPGVINKRSAFAARCYVERATQDAIEGIVSGVVTMPMNKEATQMSDPSFIGHTEYIAQLCGTKTFSMMLTNKDIAVAHLSAHVSLIDAIHLVTIERVTSVIELTNGTLSRFISNPRIAVCGLNPHAGENCLFGDEDLKVILPAIELMRDKGINVSGPFPADTIFYQAIHKDEYDAIVCMYHDQGHGPMKLIAFESAVNVTIGLPIIRTSVDHGTAFDIAWQGKAFTSSLGHALDYAWKLAGR